MPTKLEKLLEKIDPAKIIDPVENRIFKSIPKIYRDKNTVENFEEFKECLAEAAKVARNAAINVPLNAGDNIDINFGQALHYLKEEYPRDTVQTVFEIMQTGAEGGVFQILKIIARTMAEEITQNQIKAIVVEFWNSLSMEEKLSVPYEYIEKYKNILPKRIVEGDNVRMRGLFWETLAQHPKMLKRIRDLGKYR